MSYLRKTVDEHEVLANYGWGWEVVTTETTRQGLRARLKEYRENEPNVQFKTITRRRSKNDLPSSGEPK
jgi:hypothetical protein